MNDDISFVLGSALSCDGQTFVSDITSSSQCSSMANLFGIFCSSIQGYIVINAYPHLQFQF